MEHARTATRAPSDHRPEVDPSTRGPLVRPFPGLRYVPSVAGPLASLLAPPHTERDRASRRALLASSPYVVTHLERPEYDPGPGRAVTRWSAQGALVQDAPGFYVVRQEQEGRSQHFLLGQLDVRVGDDRVHAHEGVFQQAVEARLERLEATGVDSEPVLVVDSHPWPVPWTDPSTVGHLLDVADDDLRHVEVWGLHDPDVVARLSSASASHRFLIADGHHRHAAVLRAAQRDGAPRSLLVAVADDTTEPVDLRALHRIVPRAVAEEVLRRAHRRRDVDDEDVTALRGAIEGLGLDQALVVTGSSAAVIDCPPMVGPTTGSGAWVDSVALSLGTASSETRYRADVEGMMRPPEDRGAVFLPKPQIGALQEMVRRGQVLGRKTTSFRPKPLAGTVLRLR